MAPRKVFVDTSYVFALINKNDQWHSAALDWQEKIDASNDRLVTSEFVLAEIADGLSSLTFRMAAVQVIRLLESDPSVEIHPAASALFAEALDLFEQRTDKNWGLTDCTSFVIMRRFEITDALSTDLHFEQAGFKSLLRN